MDIKAIVKDAGLTLTEVARRLGEKRGKTYHVQTLNNKILYKTLRLSEAEEIADMAGGEMVFVKKGEKLEHNSQLG